MAIQQRLQSGEYASEDEVLRDALQALAERRPASVEDSVVVEGIRRGLADMKAGRSQPLEEFDQEFRAKHNIAHDVGRSGTPVPDMDAQPACCQVRGNLTYKD